MDVSTASDQIDALIERRSRERKDANAIADMWKASVERHHAREAGRWEWIRFYARLADSHARMSKEYEARAEALI